MISFIVPAHNEQASLGRTLEAIHQAARAVGQPYELIVVDDASTDATPEIAAESNARLGFVFISVGDLASPPSLTSFHQAAITLQAGKLVSSTNSFQV